MGDPSLFCSNLLEPENPRFQAVERGFEQKTYARVFRRLKLRCRLSFAQIISSIAGALPATTTGYRPCRRVYALHARNDDRDE